MMGSTADLRRPEIAVFGPPFIYRKYEKEFCTRFRVLRTWGSDLPLLQLLASQAAKIEAILVAAFAPISAEVIGLLPSLRLIVTSSRGLDQIDLDECHRRGVTVADTGTKCSDDVADLAVGLLLDVLRRISAGNRYVKSGIWSTDRDFPLGFKLGGKKCGIVGLGSIGRRVAKRLESFRCRISYHSRNKDDSVPYKFYKEIKELAMDSDSLILCCALNNETRHIINREVLLALGKQGVVVNIARGAVIDEQALVQCLKSGEIGGAGLDVFETEPLFSSELFQLDNVVLSPHASAFTEESCRDVLEHVFCNFDNFFNNKH